MDTRSALPEHILETMPCASPMDPPQEARDIASFLMILRGNPQYDERRGILADTHPSLFLAMLTCEKRLEAFAMHAPPETALDPNAMNDALTILSSLHIPKLSQPPSILGRLQKLGAHVKSSVHASVRGQGIALG